MIYLRSEKQSPKRIVPQEKRNTLQFKIMLAGIAVCAAGTGGFFLAYFARHVIGNFRDVQTYSMAAAFIGVFLYSTAARQLNVEIKKTTFYKILTIVTDIPFDPPEKGDRTKSLIKYADETGDDWRIFRNVKPEGSDFALPNVVIGPKGIFAVYPTADNPSSKKFRDPAGKLKELSDKLAKSLDAEVKPLIVFARHGEEFRSTEVYSCRLRDFSDFLLEKGSCNFSEKELEKIEKKLLELVIS